MTIGRGAMQSDYMHWAKSQTPVRYNLASSEVPHFRLDRLAARHRRPRPRWRQPLPLPAAAARRSRKRYGVAPDRVVTADGTSMANLLAMAALIAPGDEVLVEHPAYEPMVAAARFLGAEIKRFERQAGEWLPARSRASRATASATGRG